jgi:hypothetical protein
VGGHAGGTAGNQNDGSVNDADAAAGSTGQGGSPPDAPVDVPVDGPAPTAKVYEVTGSMPGRKVAFATQPGTLQYTRIVVSDQFLAESCSIGDYNNDGVPDVSAGRIWYEGPDFTTKHPFRDGHGPLPRSGATSELNTGVADDWADYPLDVDGDGWTDIVDLAQVDAPEANDPNGANPGTPSKIGIVQPHATAYWYQNPGPALAGDPKWTAHLMHSDVRGEDHSVVDFDGDGFPEIIGACRSCTPTMRKGYYQRDPSDPTKTWTFHPVTIMYTFPFGGLGNLHGFGAGDVNGDGLPDLLERGGAWLQQPGGTWNQTVCTGKNTPAGCGWIQEKTPLITFPAGSTIYSQDPGAAVGFYDSVTDGTGNKGGSNMYAADLDKDGCADVISADWAHGFGLFWYQQQKDQNGCTSAFKKFQFLGDAAASSNYTPMVPGDVAKWGAGFTEPHALEVVDMDGDGRPDVVTGKMWLAQPYTLGDRDPHGAPFLYVFRNVAAADARTGAPITLQPFLVDGDPTKAEGTTAAGMGVGHQIAIGHANTDGILDICVATKVGIAVFLGK